MTAKSKDVETVYMNMLSIGAQAELDHHQGRLKDLFGPVGYKFSMSLLTEGACNRGILGTAVARLCTAQLVLPEDEASSLHGDVMRQLLHDGYLEPVKDGYRFVSQLVAKLRLRDTVSFEVNGIFACG